VTQLDTLQTIPSTPPRPGTPYAAISDLSEDATRSRTAFTGLITPEPYCIPAHEWRAINARNAPLREWHATSLRLFDASIRGDAPNGLAESLLGHLPEHVGWRHHRNLHLPRLHAPMFFRTDQTADGVIFEVQCPGSLWGVHEILREWYAQSGDVDAGRTAPLSAMFAATIQRALGERPVIHHLLDNSSHPAGERFFIQRARQHASYFGYDEVRPKDCNFIRGHDFFALLVENFAAFRLQRLAQGTLLYDLPPLALFDQKLLLTLPFDHSTRDEYSDAVRALFPFTAMLRPDGIETEEGRRLTIAQFSALPRSRRAFFLKYAGSDVSRNWGSQSVFHLGKMSRESCESTLNEAAQQFAAGERWLLQRACESRETISYVTRAEDVVTTNAHAKHSVFYGPDGALASLVMFEDFYKVHGSTDTVTTIGVTSDDARS
jgi:hypothetical protein